MSTLHFLIVLQLEPISDTEAEELEAELEQHRQQSADTRDRQAAADTAAAAASAAAATSAAPPTGSGQLLEEVRISFDDMRSALRSQTDLAVHQQQQGDDIERGGAGD